MRFGPAIFRRPDTPARRLHKLQRVGIANKDAEPRAVIFSSTRAFFETCRKSTHVPEWAALSGAVYAREIRIATFELQKLIESGTSRLRNVLRG